MTLTKPQRPMCSGAGQTVALRQPPSHLVTCPMCGRQSLGAVNVDTLTDEGDVPPHREDTSRKAHEAQQAMAANARNMVTDEEIERRLWAALDRYHKQRWAETRR